MSIFNSFDIIPFRIVFHLLLVLLISRCSASDCCCFGLVVFVSFSRVTTRCHSLLVFLAFSTTAVHSAFCSGAKIQIAQKICLKHACLIVVVRVWRRQKKQTVRRDGCGSVQLRSPLASTDKKWSNHAPRARRISIRIKFFSIFPLHLNLLWRRIRFFVLNSIGFFN